MSNPQDKSCCRPKGPDCQFLSLDRFHWCTHWKYSLKRGMTNPGVCGCSCYKPKGSTHEEILEEFQGGFWVGAIFGVLMGTTVSISLVIFIIIMIAS